MAARAKAKKDKGTNSAPAEEIQKYLNKIHSVTDTMEEDNAAARGDINRVYDDACVKLGMTKGALKLIYSHQRKERKETLKASKMDTDDRDSLAMAAQAWGENTGFGGWLSAMASRAGSEKRESAED